MKFPITREVLQAFDNVKEQEELMEEKMQQRLANIVFELCDNFKQSMPINSKEKKFVWRELHLLSQKNLQIYNHVRNHQVAQSLQNPDKDCYLNQFIDKLRIIFVGCDIIIDPLKTYLIIDWS